MEQNEALKLLRVTEAAEMLRLTKRTIYHLVKTRKLPFYKIGSCVRFKREDVEEYLESKRVKAIGRYK